VTDKPTAKPPEDTTKAALLTAIRKQAVTAGRLSPQDGAHALLRLAGAYATLTTVPLPLLTSDPVDTVE